MFESFLFLPVRTALEYIGGDLLVNELTVECLEVQNTFSLGLISY